MMGLRKLGEIIGPHWHKVIAEEAFMLIAVALAQSLSPEHMRHMAENGMRFKDAMDDSGFGDPDLDKSEDPRVKYLVSCTDEHLLKLLDDAVPEQAEVIRQYPDFAAQMLADIRNAVGGSRAIDTS